MGAKRDTSHRGSASQFFVAGELCRRGFVAAVTLGNCPNTDILCSNKQGTTFVHIQVKTFIPGGRSCQVGRKAEHDYGERFFWVLGGIPTRESSADFTYYVIPSSKIAREVKKEHDLWLATPGENGRPHQDNDIRAVTLPPRKSPSGWSVEQYENAWHLIETQLGDPGDA